MAGFFCLRMTKNHEGEGACKYGLCIVRFWLSVWRLSPDVHLLLQPVLVAFRDQVLYLKHNLNAQAISSLKNELVAIEDNVAGLVSEMEASIKEAEQFIEALRREG